MHLAIQELITLELCICLSMSGLFWNVQCRLETPR